MSEFETRVPTAMDMYDDLRRRRREGRFANPIARGKATTMPGMRMRPGDREDHAAQRELDERERALRHQVLAAYLQAESAGLTTAIIDAEGFRAMTELRKVNQVLREHGFQGPLGAAGVEDVFAWAGTVQLHEDEAALLLRMAEAAASEFPEFSSQECQDVLSRLREGQS